MRPYNKDGQTPLSVAAAAGHVGVMVALLRAGALRARVGRKPTKHGYTLLWAAARNGQEALVRILVEVGVDVNHESVPHKDGQVPLHTAAFKVGRCRVRVSNPLLKDPTDSALEATI